MTTSDQDFAEAFDILSQFERQILDANAFGWDYITRRVKPSKATLWRNMEFRGEFNRIKLLVRGYRQGKAVYDLERSKESVKDALIQRQKEEIGSLKKQLSRERERLAYASMIARRHNIDPLLFLDQSPLLRAQAKSERDKNGVIPIRSKKAPKRMATKDES